MLADSDLEPLVLADGTRIDPTTGKRVVEPKNNKPRMIEVPAPSVAQDLVVKARKSVADLPLPLEQMSGVGLVAFYTLFGLGDLDIALACINRVTVEQVKNIRKTDAYKDFMVAARANIMETEQNNVRGLIAEHQIKAISKITSMIDSENEVLAFKASQDIADRGGNRAADIVEHRHTMDNALQIVVTTKDGNLQDVPVIDVFANMSEGLAA